MAYRPNTTSLYNCGNAVVDDAVTFGTADGVGSRVESSFKMV